MYCFFKVFIINNLSNFISFLILIQSKCFLLTTIIYYILSFKKWVQLQFILYRFKLLNKCLNFKYIGQIIYLINVCILLYFLSKINILFDCVYKSQNIFVNNINIFFSNDQNV